MLAPSCWICTAPTAEFWRACSQTALGCGMAPETCAANWSEHHHPISDVVFERIFCWCVVWRICVFSVFQFVTEAHFEAQKAGGWLGTNHDIACKNVAHVWRPASNDLVLHLCHCQKGFIMGMESKYLKSPKAMLVCSSTMVNHVLSDHQYTAEQLCGQVRMLAGTEGHPQPGQGLLAQTPPPVGPAQSLASASRLSRYSPVDNAEHPKNAASPAASTARARSRAKSKNWQAKGNIPVWLASIVAWKQKSNPSWGLLLSNCLLQRLVIATQHQLHLRAAGLHFFALVMLAYEPQGFMDAGPPHLPAASMSASMTRELADPIPDGSCRLLCQCCTACLCLNAGTRP